MKQNGLKPASSSHLNPQASGLSTKVRTYLKLGRVSNLPTVWTNTISGVILAGGSLQSDQLPTLLLSFTLFYTGGMFLNDAFDREADARTRPDRPIPSGLITTAEVFGAGFVMMATGALIVILSGAYAVKAAASATALVAAIIGYDAYHKQNPLGPWVMGVCRALIIVTAAVSVTGNINAGTAGGTAALLLYVTGVTYLAKHKRASSNTVSRLIAAISLLDAFLMAVCGDAGVAGLAVLGYAVTLAWQRLVEGT